MKHQISLGRRMAALLIDWIMSYAIAIGFFAGGGAFTDRVPHARIPVLLIFFAEMSIMTALGGASAGHRVMRMKVVRFSDGGVATPIQALIRTTLICLVITAITFDENGRGIHERFSNTKLINA
ncbi:unannotated protein [freshwater metagenome]|uniref:Unannotated protein n=1 Tax=freshwater metagenome TaxID=449393 RepID=A0A6J7D978_9ZZZZ